MTEARVRAEGELRWVQASGSGASWATASAPVSGLMGYCTEFSWTSARNIIQIMDRGQISHHKEVAKQVINLNFTIQYAATADLPQFNSGSGASVPMIHLEFRMKRPELAGGLSAGSGMYYTFHGVPFAQQQFTEGDPNTLAYTCVAVAMNGPTGSGYLG